MESVNSAVMFADEQTEILEERENQMEFFEKWVTDGTLWPPNDDFLEEVTTTRQTNINQWTKTHEEETLI